MELEKKNISKNGGKFVERTIVSVSKIFFVEEQYNGFYFFLG